MNISNRIKINSIIIATTIILLLCFLYLGLIFNKLILVISPLILFLCIFLYLNIKKYIYLLITFIPTIEILNQIGIGIKIGKVQLMMNSLVSTFFIIVSLSFFLKNNLKIYSDKNIIMGFIIYIVIGFISLLKSVDLILGIKELIKLISYLCLFIVIPLVIKDKKDLDKVVSCIIVSSIIPLIFGFYQLVTNNSPITTYLNGKTIIRLTGGFNHSNHFAYYLSIVGIILFNRLTTKSIFKSKKIELFLFLCIVFELIFTYSRTAFIFFVIIATIILIQKRKFKLLLFIFSAFFILISFINQQTLISMLEERYSVIIDILQNKNYFYNALNNNFSDSFGWRIYLWYSVISLLVEQNLLFGFGLQNFVFVAEKAIGIFIDSHNGFVKVLVETGLFGLFSFLFIIFQIFKIQLKKKTSPGEMYLSECIYVYLYIMFISLVDPVFTHGVIGFYLWLLAATQASPENVSCIHKTRKKGGQQLQTRIQQLEILTKKTVQ